MAPTTRNARRAVATITAPPRLVASAADLEAEQRRNADIVERAKAAARSGREGFKSGKDIKIFTVLLQIDAEHMIERKQMAFKFSLGVDLLERFAESGQELTNLHEAEQWLTREVGGAPKPLLNLYNILNKEKQERGETGIQHVRRMRTLYARTYTEEKMHSSWRRSPLD